MRSYVAKSDTHLSIDALPRRRSTTFLTNFKPAVRSCGSRNALCFASSQQLRPPQPDIDASTQEARVRAEVTRRIKELGRQGRPRDAVGELAAMARLGVQPDAQAATALLDACMRCNKVEMAESVFAELFDGLLTPDEVSFVVMYRGYGSQDPPRWTAISNTLATMERDFGIAPTALTFNALLETCSRTNDETRGTELIQRMVSAGVEPDEFTLDAVQKRKSLRSLLRKMFDI